MAKYEINEGNVCFDGDRTDRNPPTTYARKVRFTTPELNKKRMDMGKLDLMTAIW